MFPLLKISLVNVFQVTIFDFTGKHVFSLNPFSLRLQILTFLFKIFKNEKFKKTQNSIYLIFAIKLIGVKYLPRRAREYLPYGLLYGGV